jgi:DHA1 family tetracycline resistance protein-like MFS transporter
MSSEEQSSVDLTRFFLTFFSTKGGVQALLLSILISFGIGSTVGVVPDVLSDRYSRLYYHYDGEHCSNFDRQHKPDACQRGSDDAQSASAWATLLLSAFTLVCNPVVGSISDSKGRRGILISSLALLTLAPTVLVALQQFETMDPAFYYIANSLPGIVNYMSIIFASLADTMPEDYRGPAFAIILAGFYIGFALAPSFALVMSHFQVSVLAFVLSLSALIFTVLAFPETLPEEVSERNRLQLVEDEEEDVPMTQRIFKTMTRPVREMSILTRDGPIRLVALASLFANMVYSTDSNLLLYYIEDELNVRDVDIAQMFLLMGILGVLFQAFLLQPLIQCLGEKGLLITAFLSGTLHNCLYGLARNKKVIYVALSFSQLTKLNYPILSSFASKGVSEAAQGQVQGALFALNALGAAIGPLTMQFIYVHTKGTLGPGTMFLFASSLYFMGAIFVSFIPVHAEVERPNNNVNNSEAGLEEPLLAPESSID